jgi:prepilin-type N-terminal cleavage/methylation domain-containing protein
MSRGFTLVELMVVVAIVALVSAFALRATRSGRSDTASTFARGVVGAVHEARQAAISLGVPTRMVLNVPVGATPAVIRTESLDPTDSTQWLPLGGSVPAGRGVDLCDPEATFQLGTPTTSCPISAKKSICFQPTGSVTVSTDDTCPAANGTGATIYLTTAGANYKVVIFGLTGLPRLMDQW